MRTLLLFLFPLTVSSLNCFTCEKNGGHFCNFPKMLHCKENTFCQLEFSAHHSHIVGHCQDCDQCQKGAYPRDCFLPGEGDLKRCQPTDIFNEPSCRYCCETETCVQQALHSYGRPWIFPSSTQHKQNHSTTTVKVTSSVQKTTGSSAMSSARPVILSTDPNLQEGPTVSAEKPVILSTTPLKVCDDQVNERGCKDIPDVCNDTFAADICPRYCGLCQTTPVPTKKPCPDHTSICCENDDICDNPLGPIMCPKTCKLPTTETPVTNGPSNNPTTIATVTNSLTPTAVLCQDDDSFPCTPEICTDLDLSKTMCRRTCGLCESHPNKLVESCLDDDVFPCSPDICSDPDLPQNMCRRTCGLCHELFESCLDDDIFPCSPDICFDPDLSHNMCRRTCGLCDKRQNETVVKIPLTTSFSIIQSVGHITAQCIDHNQIYCEQADICQSPFGHIICPNRCPVSINFTSTPVVVLISTIAPSTPGVALISTVAPSTPGVPSIIFSATGKPTVSTATLGTSTSTPPPTTTTTAKPTTTTVKLTTQLPTTTKATTSISTTSNLITTKPTTNAPAVKRICHQCGDPNDGTSCTLLEIALGKPAPCQTGQYCMTDLHSDHAGNTKIVKRCVGLLECRRKWYDETSDLRACVHFDNINKVPDLTCHYCCTSDNCNTKFVPDGKLYSP